MNPQFPVIVNISGYVPQSPVSLNAMLIANVSATNPGYTVNLPGILIEDISSTDTFALVQCDSSVGELVNSVTPYGANLYILNQLGQVYGIQPQANFTTSVFVQFTGTPGFFVTNGFVVSDGTFQYIVQDGGALDASGISPLLQAIATVSGSWAVAAGTVTQLVTSIPSTITLSVTNPENGTPAPAQAETADSYRARTLQAGLATSQGMTRYVKTLLSNIPGVQANLVSVILNETVNQWEIICGGSGDPYAIASAIFRSVFNVPQLTGSILTVTGISNATIATVTTQLNHGFDTGDIITITGATIVGGSPMTVVNGVPVAITFLSQTSFTIPIDTTSAGVYAGGGVISPNNRNVTVAVLDYPNTYNITYVNPPQQNVTMVVTWNTISTNIISPTAITQLAAPAIISYINNIPVGQPINVFVLNTTFQAAVASLLPAQQLTRLIFAVSINQVGAAPIPGTGEILSDPESFFFMPTTGININQG